MDNLLTILSNPALRKEELGFLFSHLLSEDSSDEEKKEILLRIKKRINFPFQIFLSFYM